MIHASHRHVPSICPLLSQLKQPGVVAGVGMREEDAAEVQWPRVGVWEASAREASDGRPTYCRIYCVLGSKGSHVFLAAHRTIKYQVSPNHDEHDHEHGAIPQYRKIYTAMGILHID